MNKEKQIQRALSQPFKQDELEWRIQSSGDGKNVPWARIVAYVTNRGIQDRLDNVVGVFGWKNEFFPLPNSMGNGAMCGISIKHSGEWITKYDGADNTNIESTKGGLSSAMKRAAVQFGIGRYLYAVETSFAICITTDMYRSLPANEKEPYTKARTKTNNDFYWKAKALQNQFLPKKHIGKTALDLISELIAKTDAKVEDIFNTFGIDCLNDLYTDEAGLLTTVLLKKKKGIEDAKKNEKNKS